MGELPDFEVMTWQPCHLQHSAMICVQITLPDTKATIFMNMKIGLVIFNLSRQSISAISQTLIAISCSSYLSQIVLIKHCQNTEQEFFAQKIVVKVVPKNLVQYQ